jgi:hypothetical protein
MEPEWTKQIPNKTICDFYYAFFIVYAIFFGLTLVSVLSLVFIKLPKGFPLASMAFQSLLTLGIATTMMLFFYLMCDRSLVSRELKTSN